MENLVKELKQLVKFKDSTEVGDIVLIASKVPEMLVYAYVTEIERDSSRKDEWWHVKMSLLSLPMQELTWTLRTPQMCGLEIFTMGGEEKFLKAVEFKDHKKQVKKKTVTTGAIKRIK